MERERRRKIIGYFITFMIIVVCSTPQFQSFARLPDEIRVSEGGGRTLSFHLPLNFYVKSDKGGILKLNGLELTEQGLPVNFGDTISLQSASQGRAELEFRLLGLLPVRKMTVNVVPQMQVVPGGHSIGVKLKSQGVIVVGYHLEQTASGERFSPGQRAGLMVGDVILALDGQRIDGEEDIIRLVEEAGKAGRSTEALVKRNKQVFKVNLTPVKSEQDGRYRLGLWIRNSTAGVGTLTFYDPETLNYGALGHIITDLDTNRPIEVGEGQIVEAMVTSIEKGRRSQPGEKRGAFLEEKGTIGNIISNTEYGIFGKLKQPLGNPFFSEPIPVALVDEIQEGPAQILTVVDGNQIEAFDILIERVHRQAGPSGKGMVVRITDPRLLQISGGIVQGMSGSPIIQNQKLVGAVTHVFVNDPTRGYGVFIEWMLQETMKIDR